MTHDIRRAVGADRPAVEAIVAAAYSPYIPRIGRKPGPMLDDYGALIREGCVHVIVAERSVQGIVVLRPEQDAMLLENVAVAPAAQGRGYGRILLDFAERSAAAAGLPLHQALHQRGDDGECRALRPPGLRRDAPRLANGFRRVYMTKALV